MGVVGRSTGSMFVRKVYGEGILYRDRYVCIECMEWGVVGCKKRGVVGWCKGSVFVSRV